MSEDARSEGPDGPNTFDRVLAEIAAAPDVKPALRLSEGDKIGERFVVEGELGEGGMGRVVLARDIELERRVAIKLHAGLATGAALDRLRDEARAMAALSHPNVVTIHEVGTILDQLYIAMEHMPGGSLRDLMATRPPLAEILERFIEAGRGLEAAHRAGLIHRDFKPDNVLLSADGRACVADFGLARPEGHASGLAKGSPQPASKSTGSAGTPAYMAPEQLRGTSVDARSDQFSFCVALWEAVTGTLPFAGIPRREIRKRSADELVEALENRPALPARVPPRVRRVLARGVSIDPAERYESMTALLDDLAPRRSALPIVIAAALLAVAVAALLYSFWRGGDKEVSCESPDPRLDAVWSADTERAIEKRFATIDAPYAAAAVRAIAEAVPARVEAIREQRRQSCREAKVTGFMTDAHYGRSLECLDEQRARLENQVTVWASADEGVVKRVDDVLRSMPPPGRCGDARYLDTRAPVPPAEIAAEVAKQQDAVNRAGVSERNGRLEEAETLARGALEAARKLDFAPLLASALLQAGIVARLRGQADEAIALLQESLITAEAASIDSVKTRALSYLVMATAVDKADAEGAELLFKLVDARLEKAGDPWLKFFLLDSLGAVRDFQGNYDAALQYRQTAYEVARDELSGSAAIMAQAENNLGLSFHAINKLQSAVDSYTRALDLLEDNVGPFHPKLARLLDNAGLANGELGNTEVAIAQLTRGLDISKRVYGERSVEVGYSLLNLGVAHAHAGLDTKAIEHYKLALGIVSAALGPKHPDVALVLNSLGSAHEGLKQFDEALVWHRQALEVMRAQGENHPNVALVVGNIGAVELESGDPKTAITSLSDAVARWDALDKTSANLIFPLGALARAQMEVGQPRAALATAERAHLLLSDDEQNPIRIGRIKFTLARALIATRGDRDRAATLAREARAANVKAGAKQFAGRIAAIDKFIAEHELEAREKPDAP